MEKPFLRVLDTKHQEGSAGGSTDPPGIDPGKKRRSGAWKEQEEIKESIPTSRLGVVFNFNKITPLYTGRCNGWA